MIEMIQQKSKIPAEKFKSSVWRRIKARLTKSFQNTQIYQKKKKVLAYLVPVSIKLHFEFSSWGVKEKIITFRKCIILWGMYIVFVSER